MDEQADRKDNRKRVNLTDPDTRALKVRRGSINGYNAQAMVSPLALANAGYHWSQHMQASE